MIDPPSEFLWVEEGEPRSGLVAEVAPVVPLPRTYSFAVPVEMEPRIKLGQRVRIALGRAGRSAVGFIVNLTRQPWDNTLRPLDALIDEESFLGDHLIELGRRIAEHYACPLGVTLKAMTPEPVRRQSGLHTVRYARLIAPIDDVRRDDRRASAARRALVERLAESPDPISVESLLHDTAASPSILRALVTRGWVEVTVRRELAEETEPPHEVIEPTYELNDEQHAALSQVNEAIDHAAFRVLLLYGVSGSGKTEVYIHAMRRVIRDGGQAILLVPEIVLTTQFVSRLASRFPAVAVIHSGMTDSQRAVMFRRIAAGERPVIIGTRSAVFAPCPRLKLICVDEEQEPSYKNMQSPRFHVRDVAIIRAQMLNIPVVLGSATPSIETWHRSAVRGDYTRAIIRHRIRELPLPKVHLVDMRDEMADLRQVTVISRLLDRLLAETLDRGEQAILLINRRGFAHRVYCPACRMRLECPNCHVGLVVHTTSGDTICHYCRTRTRTPTLCPNVTCRAPLLQTGTGTQRVEAMLAGRFPSARICRADSDAVHHRSHYQTLIDDFAARRVDLLVGTQMIAKGLDFPFVSLVGVIQADAVSLANDFRAQERLFQLLTQVAGRAGRGDAPGQVVVQTFTPDLPAIQHALHHDYEAFVADELPARRDAALPPFSRLARIVVSHAHEDVARSSAERIVSAATAALQRASLADAQVLGPQPAPLARLRGRYRFDLLVRAADVSALRRALALLQREKALAATGAIMVDVDPVSFA